MYTLFLAPSPFPLDCKSKHFTVFTFLELCHLHRNASRNLALDGYTHAHTHAHTVTAVHGKFSRLLARAAVRVTLLLPAPGSHLVACLMRCSAPERRRRRRTVRPVRARHAAAHAERNQGM